jgi:acyl-CoA synthetase (NDP forming)
MINASSLQCARAALAGPLLRPRTIALVGVSDDPSKTAARPLQFLRRAGFEGTIYPVNPTRSTVQGEQTYPSLLALPERPDHAFILTGTDLAIVAVEGMRTTRDFGRDRAGRRLLRIRVAWCGT